jgi:glycosyltransferase involved in cell wall biosynthesis
MASMRHLAIGALRAHGGSNIAAGIRWAGRDYTTRCHCSTSQRENAEPPEAVLHGLEVETTWLKVDQPPSRAEVVFGRTDRPYHPSARRSDGRKPRTHGGKLLKDDSPTVVIANFVAVDGTTGVHTHIRQARRHLDRQGTPNTVVTSRSWGRLLRYPVFSPQLVLRQFSKAAEVAWSRHFCKVFVRNALRRYLAKAGNCVIYAQEPLSAWAAIRARQGPHQRVVMAVHFRTSQADELARAREIKQDGIVFRAIRQVEREVIPQVDGLVYVSVWARDALLSWLPEAATVPSAVIGNFVAPAPPTPTYELLGDLVTTGALEPVKNHRYLLDILAETKRAGRPLTLDIFGEGPLRTELVHQAHSLGLQDQVRFRGFRPDVRDFLPRYRAYVHASYSESSSMAIIEAMAAQLPIIAGDAGAISELCDDGVEARFWPLDDPARAAATLTGLLDDEPARLRAAKAARERFHRDFDADVIAPRLHAFLLGTGIATAAGAIRPEPTSLSDISWAGGDLQ